MFVRTEQGIMVTSSEATDFFKRLDAGVYNFKYDDTGWGAPTQYLIPTDVYNKDYNVDCGVFQEITDTVENFLSPAMKKTRNMLNMHDRIGLLFYGSPGTGKTFLAGQIAYTLAKTHEAVGIIIKGVEGQPSELIDMIRKNDPNRMIILIFDEFEKSGRQGATDLLSFLDGSNSKNNSIVIGTLNNFQKLPNTITARPGRFECIFEFIIEDEEMLEHIVTNLIPDELKSSLSVKAICMEVNTVIKAANENNEEYVPITIDYIKIVVKDTIFRHFNKD